MSVADPEPDTDRQFGLLAQPSNVAGRYPLAIAARNNHPAIVQTLLKHLAALRRSSNDPRFDVDVTDALGMTPLMHAVETDAHPSPIGFCGKAPTPP